MNTQFLIDNAVLIAIAVTSGVFLLLPAFRGGAGQRVSPLQASLMINRSKAVVLDIREADQVKARGVIPDARRLAIADIKEKVAGTIKDKALPVLVMCQNGQRSGAAASVLKSLGYTQVFVVDGGVEAWIEAGMPVNAKAA
jgi:rhodanese-related sulfurtransferase